MVYFTKNLRPNPCYEKMSKIDCVERSGVVPVKRMIESMIDAGIRLQGARQTDYDYSENVKDDDLRPVAMRGSGFDQFDALNMLNGIRPHEVSYQPEPDKKSGTPIPPVEEKE